MPRVGTHQKDGRYSLEFYPNLACRPYMGCSPLRARAYRVHGHDRVPLAGTASSNGLLTAVEKLNIFLLGRIIFCCDIHEGIAQYSCVTHIVLKSKGDVRALTPTGHPEVYRTNNGEPSPIDIMENRYQLIQRLYLGVIRQ